MLLTGTFFLAWILLDGCDAGMAFLGDSLASVVYFPLFRLIPSLSPSPWYSFRAGLPQASRSSALKTEYITCTGCHLRPPPRRVRRGCFHLRRYFSLSALVLLHDIDFVQDLLVLTVFLPDSKLGVHN